MKKNWGTDIVRSVKEKGYIEVNGVMYPPDSSYIRVLKQNGTLCDKPKKKRRETLKRTGWVDDTRNIRNKEKYKDAFMFFVERELGVVVYPEFYFSTERMYRFDYCIPMLPCGKVVKCAIECDGGIYMKGESGHSSGKGIKRDQDKASLAASNGWLLIRRTPTELLTMETLELIKKIIGLDGK